MHSLLSEKYLILLFTVLFSLSAVFLFWQNKRELDPNQGKSWWTLSFAAPGDQDSLTFVVENHTSENEFRYYITHSDVEDIETSFQESFFVAPGETKTITPPVTTEGHRKTIITVTSEAKSQQIYR